MLVGRRDERSKTWFRADRVFHTNEKWYFHTREGIPSALVSLPLRYMHSVVEMVDLRDVEQVIDLLVGFVESVTEKDNFALKI